jgi:protein-tyrosine phosphatase
MKILFVCLGNICRSPIAEGIMKHICGIEQLDWEIDSAGTESYHIGQAPHEHSQQVCLEHGIDISKQRARKYTHADIAQYDKIYALATDVYEEIKDISGHYFDENKIELFLSDLYPDENRSVKDPYNGELKGYYDVFDEIQQGCQAIQNRYKKNV